MIANVRTENRGFILNSFRLDNLNVTRHADLMMKQITMASILLRSPAYNATSWQSLLQGG
jgi:hypothetical protein